MTMYILLEEVKLLIMSLGVYEDKYQATISKTMEDNTRKYSLCRIVRIAKYWEEHCLVNYFTSGRIVPETEYDDRNGFYYNLRCKKDIVYAELNVKFLRRIRV